MNKLILAAILVLATAGLVAANTEAPKEKIPGAVWIEGGSPIGKAGSSVAVGIRFSHVGIKFGYGGAF